MDRGDDVVTHIEELVATFLVNREHTGADAPRDGES
jgi:hypothetical protein